MVNKGEKMEDRSLPVVLVVYIDKDEFLAEQFFNELSFLRESEMVELQRWFLSERYTDRETVERFQTRINKANIIIVLGSRYLSQSSELRSLLTNAIYEYRKNNIVIPVILTPMTRDETGWLREFNEQPLPRSASSMFGERESTDADALYHDVVNEVVEKLIATFFPKPHRGISQKTVFISYSRKNFRRANVIRLATQRLGYKTWMDKKNIVGGQNWVNRIDKGIRGSWCLLLIWSDHARSSEYVNYEWAFAMGHQTCVIPIMIEQAKVHPRLTTINYLGWHNLTSAHYPWHDLEQALNDAEWNYNNGTCNS
jgi:hypothetical protein